MEVRPLQLFLCRGDRRYVVVDVPARRVWWVTPGPRGWAERVRFDGRRAFLVRVDPYWVLDVADLSPADQFVPVEN